MHIFCNVWPTLRFLAPSRSHNAFIIQVTLVVSLLGDFCMLENMFPFSLQTPYPVMYIKLTLTYILAETKITWRSKFFLLKKTIFLEIIFSIWVFCVHEDHVLASDVGYSHFLQFMVNSFFLPTLLKTQPSTIGAPY